MSYNDYENGYSDGYSAGKDACEEERARADEKKALDERLTKIEDTLALILSLWERPTAR